MSAKEKIARALEGDPKTPQWMRRAMSTLVPAGWAYGAGMSLRWSLYDTGLWASRVVSCPVVSVGNLTLGGTGKSTVVAWIVEQLMEVGRRPAVVSRGYGGGLNEITVVSDGMGKILCSPPAADEAVMLARRFPSIAVITGRDRSEAAERAEEEFGAEIIVVDDGFQHMALHRDLDIVVLRGERPFGNGRVFPAGALREPVGGLRRARVILLMGEVRPDDRMIVERAGQGKAVFTGEIRPVALSDVRGRVVGKPSDLKGATAIAVSGIGYPEGFSRILEEIGVRVLAHRVFSDHTAYPRNVLDGVVSSLKHSGADFIITTEKDIVKMGALAEVPCLRALRVEMKIDRREELIELILNVFQKISRDADWPSTRERE